MLSKALMLVVIKEEAQHLDKKENREQRKVSIQSDIHEYTEMLQEGGIPAHPAIHYQNNIFNTSKHNKRVLMQRDY